MKNSAKSSFLLVGVVSLSIQAATAFTCPTQSKIGSKEINELASTGRAVIDGSKIRLTPPTSGQNYKAPTGQALPVLSDSEKLSVFLKSVSTEGKVSAMGYQSSNAQKDVCEYSVTVGSNTGRQTAIVALREDTGAPTRAAPPAPKRNPAAVDPKSVADYRAKMGE